MSPKSTRLEPCTCTEEGSACDSCQVQRELIAESYRINVVVEGDDAEEPTLSAE